MLSFTTPVLPTVLVIEESPADMSRYKGVHAAGCSGVRDPEFVRVVAGTVGDVARSLTGFAVIDAVDEAELPELDRQLKPCARKALGLS